MPVEIGGTEYDFNVVENGELVQYDSQLGDGTVLSSSDGGSGGGGDTSNQYYWTAEDYTVGDVPSEWDATNATIEIAQDANSNNYLDVTAPDETRTFLEFLPAPAAEFGEVWMRFQTGGSGDIWAFLRGQNLDTPSDVSMTRTDYMPENNLDRLGEFGNGGYGAIDDKALTTPSGSIGQLRGSFDGDTLQGRWWDDGTSEPGSWGLTGTTTVTGQGVAGVGHWRGTDIRIYEFGVGVSGDPAPTSPV